MKRSFFLLFILVSSTFLMHGRTPPRGELLWEMQRQTTQSVADVMLTNNTVSGGYTINTPGTYALAENVTSAAATAINITASNVTLDLNGHTLTGAGGTNVGVAVSATSNVHICNGKITNCTGISATSTISNLWIDMIQSTPSTTGTSISITTTATNGYIDRCFMNGGVTGIFAASAKLYITSCMVKGTSSHGMTVIGNGSVIENTIVESAGGSGFIIGNDIVVRFCTAMSNTADGFLVNTAGLNGSTSAIVYDSTASSNLANGFTSTVSASSFVRCIAFGNVNNGFNASNAATNDNAFISSTAYNNGNNNFFIAGINEFIVANCLSFFCGTGGFALPALTSVFRIDTAAVTTVNFWMNGETGCAA